LLAGSFPAWVSEGGDVRCPCTFIHKETKMEHFHSVHSLFARLHIAEAEPLIVGHSVSFQVARRIGQRERHKHEDCTGFELTKINEHGEHIVKFVEHNDGTVIFCESEYQKYLT
jgi:hypothetical protein